MSLHGRAGRGRGGRPENSLENSIKEATRLLEESVNVSTTLQDIAHSRTNGKADAVGISTFMTDVDVSSVQNQCPTISGNSAIMSEDLSSRIYALADIIGVAGMKTLHSCVQSNLDQVCRISRVLGNTSCGNQDDIIRRLHEEEMLRRGAEATNASLRDKLAVISAQVRDLQQQVQVLNVFQEESKAQAKRREADYRTLENELSATAEKLRMEEAERLVLVDQMRKKEAEVLKCKETVDKLTSELQRLAVKLNLSCF